MNKERFETLDCFRGLFAVVVVLFHYALYFNTPLTHVGWLKNGYLMVDAFFVLSGFVMVHAAAGRLQTGRHVLAFMVRRFFRLWPLHALVLGWLLSQELLKLYLQHGAGVETAHMAFTEAFALDKLAASLMLVHALDLFHGQVWNVPSWSISTEFYAYLVFVLVAWRARPLRLISVSLLVLIVASYRLLHLPGEVMDVTTQGGFVRCLYGFFTGVLAYYSYAWIKRRAGLVGVVSFLQAPIVILLCTYMSVAGNGLLAFLAPLVFFLLVIAFANDQGVVARSLQVAPLTFLGKISYSVYLVHYPLILFVFRVLELLQRRFDIGLTHELVHGYPLMGFAQGWQTALFMCLLSLLILLVSYLTWRWVELPFQVVGRRYANQLRG